MSDIKIGTKLYKCAPPYLMEYLVIGIREYPDNIQYELECQSCKHGTKCIILAGGKPNHLSFIQVLNDEDDEHHHWHSDDTKYWFKPQHARLERINHHIREYENKVSENKRIYETSLKNYNELLNAKELLNKELAVIKEQTNDQ